MSANEPSISSIIPSLKSDINSAYSGSIFSSNSKKEIIIETPTLISNDLEEKPPNSGY